MRPEDLQHLNRGALIKAAEWNAVVDGVQAKPFYAPLGGNVGGQYTGDPSVNGDPSFIGVNTSEGDIPAFSVFGIKADEDDENYDGRPLRFVVDQIMPNGINTGTLRLFTNPYSPIPANGGEATIKAIGNTIPRLVRVNQDEIPNVGDICGPNYGLDAEDADLGTYAYTITFFGYGLLCLGHVQMDIDAATVEGSEEESSSGGEKTYAVVVSAFEASSFVVKITEEVTAFNASTHSLGIGTAKVQFRNGGVTDDAIDIGDARAPANDEVDWEFTVYSVRTETIPVGQVEVANLCAGVGLVIASGGSDNGSSEASSGSSGTCPTKIDGFSIDDIPEYDPDSSNAGEVLWQLVFVDGCWMKVAPGDCD